MKKLMTMFVTVMLFAFVGLGAMGSSAADQPAEMQYEQPAMEGMQPALQGDSAMPAEGSRTIQGIITLVGKNQLNVKETATGIEHQIRIDKAQEKMLTTGYEITAQIDNGRLVAYTLGGVPPNVKEIVYTARNLPEENVLEQQQMF